MTQEATAEQQADDGILRKFTRELPVRLTDHENQMYGKMLADKVNELKLAEEKKKQVTADHNNRIKVIEAEITRIAVARAKGEELRPVVCGERLHGNVIEIYRLDLSEVVDTRPAEMADLQTSMPGMGPPQIPDGFDEGPRGSALGSLADQPVADEQPPGEMTTSSMGDQVFTGGDREDEPEGGVTDDEDEDPLEVDDVLNCDACGQPVKGGDATVLYEGSTIHADCAPDGYEVPPSQDDNPDNVVRPDFSGVPGQGDGETEDEYIERKLQERESQPSGSESWAAQRDRDIAQRDKEIAEDKAKPKPTRERSKKANASKNNGKAKKK